ncbi:MAG: HEPN domain-containing protein [Deltaproteobacteria bacterium]|nr:HEPN domain-containing protein [Deltaproteobacteria bacterium]
MTAAEKKDSLIRYRLQQAKESIDDAVFLFENKRGLRSVVNRIYYAMFYAVLAALVKEPFQSSKHSGVIGYFNQHFIKEGIFPPETGKYLNLAFEARQESDYKEFSELTADEVHKLLGHAVSFIKEVEKYLGHH